LVEQGRKKRGASERREAFNMFPRPFPLSNYPKLSKKKSLTISNSNLLL